jgi:hypothetical protein
MRRSVQRLPLDKTKTFARRYSAAASQMGDDLYVAGPPLESLHAIIDLDAVFGWLPECRRLLESEKRTLEVARLGVGSPRQRVGTCVDYVLVEVPCDGPHDREIVAVLTVDDPPGASYPPARTFRKFHARCEREFVRYVEGGVFATIETLIPSQQTWALNDRQIACGAVYDPDVLPLGGLRRICAEHRCDPFPPKPLRA